MNSTSKAAAALGRVGGSVSSDSKTAAARANGKKGGRPSKFHVFEEADGFHWCEAGLGYLDARGRAYPSRTAARNAAREAFAHAE